MTWVQKRPKQKPSLGYAVAAWIEDNCCYGPGDKQGEPAFVDLEMLNFIVDAYLIDEVTGRRVYDEAVLSRPKGRAKTEIAGWLVCAEAYSPEVRFDHWDEDGQPVGRKVTSPLIKCLATEESQATAAFSVVSYVVEWGKHNQNPVYEGSSGVRAYQSATAIYIPSGGEIRACSSGAASKDGGKETFVVCDESHLYVLPALRNMYATIRRNLGKRMLAEPWMLQTTTAYRQGELSIAEETLVAWRKEVLSPTVLVDHREAKGPIRIRDRDHTIKQLENLYAVDWMDYERLYREMLDPRSCPDDATAARYFLNRVMATVDAWIAKDIYERQTLLSVVVDGTPISLGFDGSLNEDSTVLRGCRMSDGYLFTIGIWEKPRDAGKAIGWEVPRREVIDTWEEAFERYQVVRMYADPHEWRSDIDNAADKFRTRLPRGKTEERVVSWETRRDTAMAYALDRLHSDLVNGVVFHDDDPVASEHYGNAYVRHRGSLRLVRKEYPNSPRKIDTVVADALAYEARADAIADGWDVPKGGLTRAKGKAASY